MNKIIAYSVCVIYFFTSCASYNYNGRNNDRLITIKADNVNDFQLVNSKSLSTMSTASSGQLTTRLADLKKDNLKFTLSHPNYEPINIEVKRVPRTNALIKDVGLGIFTFGIPVIIDVFKSDFYRVSPSSKLFQVHFEFKQSFMLDEYEKIKASTDPEIFQNWISKYAKSYILQEVIDHKDSLELIIALSKENETSIDDFISTHQESNYLNQAKQIKSEMVAARELFEKTKAQNTVEAYESFLEKYPRSLHNTEAHKRLIDAAEKRAVASLSSSKMTEYINIYLIPNSRFLTENELSQKKTTISKAIDLQLIKENIKTDPKKNYEYYSNLWKSYLSVKAAVDPVYLNHLEQSYSYQVKICNLLFAKLKECSTKEKQDVLVAKIKSDFPSLDIYDDSKNPIITILENFQNGTGTIKLFNVGYFPYYFDNMSERNALIGRANYTYRGSDFQALKGITYEEASFVNGQLNGVSKCFIGNQLDFTLTMGTSGPKEIGYYQGGKLIEIVFFPVGAYPFQYEYENGKNLTIKVIEDVISQLTIIETKIRNYTKTKDYNLIVSEYEKIENILEPAVTLIKNNPIPKDKGENLLLAKARSIDALLNAAIANKKEDDRIAEERKQKEMLAFYNAILNSASSSSYSSSGSSNNGSNSSSSSQSPKKSDLHVYICDDCGKVQTAKNKPYDKSTCPETRWGGIGGAGNLFDDGDHNYSDLGNSGSQQYVCNGCHISIMLYEKPRYPGTCGARGSNCCSHSWVKN